MMLFPGLILEIANVRKSGCFGFCLVQRCWLSVNVVYFHEDRRCFGH